MKFTLKKILGCISAILAIVAFFMMFVSPLKYVGTFIQEDCAYSDIYLNSELFKGASICLVAFIVVLISGIYLAVSEFLNIPFNKYIKIAIYVLLIICAILIFCTRSIWINVNAPDASPELIAELKEVYKAGAGVILGGLFTLFSAIIGAFAHLFVKK